MAHRYFTSDIGGGTARITGADARHLARVLRARPGQVLTLCDGAGTDYVAEITAAAEDEVLLRVHSSAPTAVEPGLWAEVFLGVAKGERMDWAVQKSVELGASAIRPFYSEFSVVKPKNDEKKTERWQRIVDEAAKQCGRGILPAVAPPLSFAGVLAAVTSYDAALFFYEAGGLPLRRAVGGEKRLALITGAEGGFSAAEAEAAVAAGCRTVSLGPRILRCETAPAAALAAVMTLTGNLE